MPALLPVSMHPLVLQCLTPTRLDGDLPLVRAAAKLKPRFAHDLLVPCVVEPAVLGDRPRPQERLAPALDDKVREQEQHAHVARTGDRLAERVRRGPCEVRRPHCGELAHERERRGLGLVQHVWAVARAEAEAEQDIALAHAAPLAVWLVRCGLFGRDHEPKVEAEDEAVYCVGCLLGCGRSENEVNTCRTCRKTSESTDSTCKSHRSVEMVNYHPSRCSNSRRTK